MNTYNLVIVEDESKILKMLMYAIPWRSLGFRAVAGFLSAEEAFEYIEGHAVDVLLTDIQLIKMNGLDLIGMAAKVNSQLISVILTSHESFEYAKQAINLNVFDYLTKPLEVNSVKNVFNKIFIQLEERHKNAMYKVKYDEYAKKQIIIKFFRGIELDDEEALWVPQSYKSFFIMKLKPITGKAILSTELRKQLVFPDVEVIMAEEFESLVFGFYFKNDFVNDIMLDALNVLTTLYKKSIIGISKVYHDIEFNNQAYIEADVAINCYFYVKKNIIFYELTENLRYIGDEHYEVYKTITDEVQALIEKKEYDRIAECINKYLLDFDINNLEEIKNIYIELILFISNRLFDKTNKNFINVTVYVHQALKYNTEKELERHFAKYIKFIKDNFLYSEGVDLKSIRLALDFIEKNYQKQITLNDLSKVAYLHPVYLSKVFKNEVGQNFLDYLSLVRVKNAKKMLADVSLKVNYISEMVGYLCPKHFCKQFKKVTGMTPSDYRNKYLHEQQV